MPVQFSLSGRVSALRAPRTMAAQLRRLGAIAVFTAGAAGSCNERPTTQVQAGGYLDLQEHDVLQLNPLDQVAGGIFLSDHRIAYWTPHEARISAGPNRFRPLCENEVDSVRGLSQLFHTQAFEILDRHGVLRVADGTCARRINVPRGVAIASGARSDRGWVWIQQAPSGEASLGFEEGSAALAEKIGGINIGLRLTKTLLTLTPGRVGVLTTEPPFDWSVISDSGVILVHFATPQNQ